MDNVASKTLRVLLRSVPFVPAPELIDLLEAVQKSRSSIDEKVRRAVLAVEQATALFDEVEATLKDRSAKLEELRAEVQRYSALAAVEEGKAAALIKQIEGALNRGRSTERWVSLGINVIAGLIFFILGAWLGPKLAGFLQPQSSTVPEMSVDAPRKSVAPPPAASVPRDSTKK